MNLLLILLILAVCLIKNFQLIAEKRYACLNEANRLKAIIYNAESYCQRPIISRCNGSIFLKSIKVPLLNEFLVARAKEKGLTKF